MSESNGAKRPYRLTCKEMIWNGDKYEEKFVYYGRFKTYAHARRGAAIWARKHEYELSGVEMTCGYDIKILVCRFLQAMADERRAFWEHESRRNSLREQEQILE